MRLILTSALAALTGLSACGDNGLADQLARKEAKDARSVRVLPDPLCDLIDTACLTRARRVASTGHLDLPWFEWRGKGKPDSRDRCSGFRLFRLAARSLAVPFDVGA